MDDRTLYIRSVKLDPVDVNKITETPVPLHNGETIIGLSVEDGIAHVLVLHSRAAEVRHSRREYEYYPTGSGHFDGLRTGRVER